MGQVVLEHLAKTFGDFEAIKDANLVIEDGEFTVFVGPSGCGKSTMLRMIAGLEDITGGHVKIDGEIVNDKPPVERGISMVFQSYALYPHMSVYENIAFPLRVAKMKADEIDARVQHAARILKLEDRLQNKPGALSGGQRQRVAIGRSIVREPKVFLFDEPLSNLDAALRADMRVELSELHKELKNTMIYVTHDQVEAMTMADKIVVLRDGDVIQVGSPLELYYLPQNKFVAGFIGNPNMNFLKASFEAQEAEGMRVNFNGQSIVIPVDGEALAPGAPVEIGIRPDELALDSENARFEIVPEVVEHLGGSTVVYTQSELSEDKIRLVLTGTARLAEDHATTVGFSPANAHLFDENGNAFRRRIDISAFSALPPSYQEG